MNQGRRGPAVLHVCNDPKFTLPLFAFLVDQGFDLSDHHVFHYRCRGRELPELPMGFTRAGSFLLPDRVDALLPLLLGAERIVLHSIASPYLLTILAARPDLCRKVFWIIWGKDLYFYRTARRRTVAHRAYEQLRRRVLPHIGHIVTDVPGDVARAREWYDNRGKHIRGISYPSNLFPGETLAGAERKQGMVIQVGNSGDSANEHAELFERLAPLVHSDTRLFVPLPYGDKGYVREIIDLGERQFGDRFEPQPELVPLAQYQQRLADVDVAVFGHHRQQATGNIVTLLGLGKKVFLRSSISSWDYYQSLGLEVYDLETLELSPLPEPLQVRNRDAVRLAFSPERLASQWREIFSWPLPHEITQGEAP